MRIRLDNMLLEKQEESLFGRLALEKRDDEVLCKQEYDNIKNNQQELHSHNTEKTEY